MSNIFDRIVTQKDVLSQADEALLPLRTSHEDTTNEQAHTAADVKKAVQELLRSGYLEEAQKSDLFHTVTRHEAEITTILEPLDLELRLDTHRGVTFLAVAQAAYENRDDDAWNHPLVRRQRMTLEQSLLVAILRQIFVIHEQKSGVGQSVAKIAVDELLPQFLTYFDDSGSDAKNEARLLNLLDQLKPHGIVSEVDRQQEVTIRPLIAYLADPASLAALLDSLRVHSQRTDATEHED